MEHYVKLFFEFPEGVSYAEDYLFKKIGSLYKLISDYFLFVDPDTLLPELKDNDVRKLVSDILTQRSHIPIPITEQNDFPEVSKEQLQELRDKIACMKKDVNRLDPALEDEKILLKEELASYLFSDWEDMPAKTVIYRRQTNLCTLYYFYPYLQIEGDKLITLPVPGREQQEEVKVEFTATNYGALQISVSEEREHSTWYYLKKRLNVAIDNLNINDLPTGILYDRVLPFSDIHNYDGQVKKELVQLPVWKQIYHEMQIASLDSSQMKSISSVVESAENFIENGTVPLGILKFRFNHIDANAFKNNTITVHDGKFLLNENADAIFLEEKVVFAASALKDKVYYGNVSFILDNQFYLTNQIERPVAIKIDLDDGNSFQEVTLGSKINANYTETGQKQITLRAHYQNINEPNTDDIFESRFEFNVEALTYVKPDDIKDITSDRTYTGKTPTGKAYMWFGKNPDGSKKTFITQPLIIAKYFDPLNEDKLDKIYEKLQSHQLFERVINLGYDLFFLDYDNGGDYIQNNAYLFNTLLKKILDQPTLKILPVVIGISMGGLVSRYGLMYLQKNEGKTKVADKFITFDSPHYGANIPVGIQYLLDGLKSDSDAAKDIVEKILNCPAARQMLVYHYKPGYNITVGASDLTDPLRTTFLAELNTMGNFPSIARMVGISSGSGYGINQGYSPNDHLFDLGIICPLFNLYGSTYADPNCLDQKNLNLFYESLSVPGMKKPSTMAVSADKTVAGYDTAPGGSRGTMKQFYDEVKKVKIPLTTITPNMYHENHCFVPVVSSLAVSSDIFANISADPDVYRKTPFTKIYYPLNNSGHCDLTVENVGWLVGELTTSASTLIPDGTYTIRSVCSNQLLICSRNGEQNAPVVIFGDQEWEKKITNHQAEWVINKYEGNHPPSRPPYKAYPNEPWYQIRNKQNGQLLIVGYNGAPNGPVQVIGAPWGGWGETPDNPQKMWRIIKYTGKKPQSHADDPRDWFQIQNVSSGQLLIVAEGGRKDGPVVVFGNDNGWGEPEDNTQKMWVLDRLG